MSGITCYHTPEIEPLAMVKRYDISEFNLTARSGDVWQANTIGDDCYRLFPQNPPMNPMHAQNWVSKLENIVIVDKMEDLNEAQVIHRGATDTCNECDSAASARIQVQFKELNSNIQLIHNFPELGGGSPSGPKTGNAGDKWPSFTCHVSNLNTTPLEDNPDNRADLKFWHKLSMYYKAGGTTSFLISPRLTAACTTNPTWSAYKSSNVIRGGASASNNCGILSGVDLVSAAGGPWNKYDTIGAYEEEELNVDMGCNINCPSEGYTGTDEPENNIKKRIYPELGKGAKVVSTLYVKCQTYEDAGSTPEVPYPESTVEFEFTGDEFDYVAYCTLSKSDDSGTPRTFPINGIWTNTSVPSLNLGEVTSNDDLTFKVGHTNNLIGSLLFTRKVAGCKLEIMIEGTSSYVDFSSTSLGGAITDWISWPDNITHEYKNYSVANIGASAPAWKEGTIKISDITANAAGFPRGIYKATIAYEVENKATNATETVGTTSASISWEIPSTFFVANA
jgi:hypothetical protein